MERRQNLGWQPIAEKAADSDGHGDSDGHSDNNEHDDDDYYDDDDDDDGHDDNYFTVQKHASGKNNMSKIMIT